MSDDYIEAFEAFRVEEFHHADHVRLAWCYLRAVPLLPAIERFTTSLRRFAAHHGKPELYHETITWAYMLLIHERMNGEDTFEAFREANPELFRWKPSLLESYYHPATLQSARARKTFIMPDRALA